MKDLDCGCRITDDGSRYWCPPCASNAGKPGTITLVRDDLSARLDEVADLCEHWKLWRVKRSHTPQAVRSALVMLAREIVLLADMEARG